MFLQLSLRTGTENPERFRALWHQPPYLELGHVAAGACGAC